MLLNLLKKGLENIFFVSGAIKAPTHPDSTVEKMLEDDNQAINDDFINAIMKYESQ